MPSLLDRPSTWSFDRPGRVLRIEREADPALRAALQAVGVECASSETAHEAILRIRDWEPDVIVVPPLLEDMDTESFLAAVKALPHSHVRSVVVVFTVRADDASAVAVLEAGADDVIVAPCSTEVLCARLRAHLREARSKQALLRDSMRDSLTGVFSRGFFVTMLRMRIARLLRQRSDCLCLILVDMDEPTEGTRSADSDDRVLRRIASLLDLACREGDLVARYGGRTFVLTLSGATQTQGAVVADRLRRTIAEEEIEDLAITVSAGVAAWETERPSESGADEIDPQAVIEALLRGADAALEDAKRRGPNRVSTNAWSDPAFAALAAGGASSMN